MDLEPTLTHIVNSSLQWIFVGGKGGVGKTTTSCSLATLLAASTRPTADGGASNPKVLIISTDPAHNLSDAFDQKLQHVPTPIKGAPNNNLFGMEIDPTSLTSGKRGGLAKLLGVGGEDEADEDPDAALFKDGHLEQEQKEGLASALKIIKKAASTLPGIDELTVFVEIMHTVKDMSFDIVVFDTAPTGHTLRLLAMPQTLTTTMNSISEIKGLSSIFSLASSLLENVTGSGGLAADPSAPNPIIARLQALQQQVEQVQHIFSDSERTAFICVCIPEFLSVYETERLVQELMKYSINCDSIVINQLVLKPRATRQLVPSADGGPPVETEVPEPPCRMCQARQKIQGRYLDQIAELYEDFHCVRMPLHGDEVRGVPALMRFARFLTEPYNPDIHGYL